MLYKELSKIYGVISSKPLIPILEDFMLEVEDNVLTATASDLQTTMIVKIPVTCENNVKVAIPSKILIDTLKSLPDQPLIVNVYDNNVVELVTINGKYKIIGESALNYPCVKMTDASGNVSIHAGILRNTIQSTIIAASNDPLKPVLNSVLFDFYPQKLVMVATDTHRLIKYSCSIDNDETFSLIIPKKSLYLLGGVLSAFEDNATITLSFNQNYLCVSTGGNILYATLVNGRFPDYERVIPKNHTKQMSVLCADLTNTLKRITVYTNSLTKQVQFTVKDGELTIVAHDINFNNQAVETLKCSYNSDEILNICYNSKYLYEMLQGITCEEVLFSFADPNKENVSTQASLVHPFKQKNDHEIEMLIMPMVV